ncbi:hypothetical protein ABPG74_013559 [Tetrahymena malaccensis]
MDELHEIIQQRVKKAQELNEIFQAQDDSQQRNVEGFSQLSRSKILSNMLRKAKEDEKYRIEKENWILNVLKAFKDPNTIQKNFIYNRSIDIMKLIFPQFEYSYLQSTIAIEQQHVFINKFVALYQSFFQTFEKCYEFKQQFKFIVRPQNQYIIYDMIRYLVEFSRDYFTQFVIYWQNFRNRDIKQTQLFQQSQIASHFINQARNQNIQNMNNKSNQVIAVGQALQQYNPQLQSTVISNQIKALNNNQNFTVTVSTQFKLQQRSISSNNINSLIQQSNIDDCIQDNNLNKLQSKAFSQCQLDQKNESESDINQKSIKITFQSANQQLLSCKEADQHVQNIDFFDEIQCGQIKDRDEDPSNQFSQHIQNTQKMNHQDKKEQGQDIHLKLNIDSSQNEINKFKEYSNENYVNLATEDTVTNDLTRQSRNQFQLKSQLYSKDVSPLSKNKQELDMPQLDFSKSYQLMQKRQSPLRQTKYIEQTKTQPRRAVETIQFNNPSINNTWFNKKINRIIEFQSIFTSYGQLSDVMQDIDQSAISLTSYKLRKLRDLNSADTKQQQEDLQQWMRNTFEISYSRNQRISNSIQGYLLILEECYKNNFNFRSKLGEFYKSNVIKNNIETHETSSLIIKIQQNRLVMAQKKINKNKTDINFMKNFKFQSEQNLESIASSPVSKKQKSKKMSIHSSQNLDQQTKCQNIQQESEINYKSNTKINDQCQKLNQVSQIEILNHEIKETKGDEQQDIDDIQCKKCEDYLIKKEIQPIFNRTQAFSSTKKRQNSIPKLRMFKNYSHQKDFQSQFEANSNLDDTKLNQISNNQKATYDQIQMQQFISKSAIKASQSKILNQKQVRNVSPQKNADYLIEFKTKIIKLQPNQNPISVFNDQNFQSILQETDAEQDKSNNMGLEQQNDQTDNKKSITINKNIANKLYKVKSVHSEKDLQNQINPNNQAQNAATKIKQTIQLYQQDQPNLNKVSQNYLQKSLTKQAYQSKFQQEKNLLQRLQKPNLPITNLPQMNVDLIQKFSQLEINQLFPQLQQNQSNEVQDELYFSKQNICRISPFSKTPQNLVNNNEVKSFSTQNKNLQLQTKDFQESPSNLDQKCNKPELINLNLLDQKNLTQSEKKSSPSISPFSRNQSLDQKGNYEKRKLFSEKFKLLVQRTEQNPVESENCIKNENQLIQANQMNNEYTHNQKQLQDENRQIKITSNSQQGIFEQNSSNNNLNKYEISSQRKTKRSESAVSIKYNMENSEQNNLSNFYIASTFNAIDQYNNFNNRASEFIIDERQSMNQNMQNQMNFSQDNYLASYQLSNQKDFVKLLANSNFKKNLLHPHLKQKTSSEFFQQIYSKISNNRKLHSSSQLRRQYASQNQFDSLLQQMKSQQQQQKDLPLIAQENQFKNNYKQQQAQLNQQSSTDQQQSSSQLKSSQQENENQFDQIQITQQNEIILIKKAQESQIKSDIKHSKYEGQVRKKEKSNESLKVNQIKKLELKQLKIQGVNQQLINYQNIQNNQNN